MAVRIRLIIRMTLLFKSIIPNALASEYPLSDVIRPGHRMTRMKIAGLSTFGILAFVLVLLYAQESVIFETYLIPSTMKEGWVTIELGNPKCPPLNKGKGWREMAIQIGRASCRERVEM